MNIISLAERRKLGEIFWENLDYYRQQYGLTWKELARLIANTDSNYFYPTLRTYRFNQRILREDKIWRITLLFQIRYTDLFKDWNNP